MEGLALIGVFMTVSERLQQIRFGGGDLNAQALKECLLSDLDADNVADIYAHIDYLEKRCARLEKISIIAEEIGLHVKTITSLTEGE